VLREQILLVLYYLRDIKEEEEVDQALERRSQAREDQETRERRSLESREKAPKHREKR